jgi:hypothetical protein
MQSPHQSTEPAPIHLLGHSNTPICGAKACSRAWHVSSWPSTLRLWPSTCPTCWDRAHTPVARAEQKEVA